MKKTLLILMCALMVVVVPGCDSMSKTGKGALLGTGAGAAVGAGIGAIIGKGKGAAIGAAIGGAVGAGAGTLIGRKMDKKAEELKAALENADIEKVTDVNGLEAIKVTFESGILFPTNGTTLSDVSKTQLSKFASKMKDMEETDITIFGHTDNTGTAAVNERISKQRADAVQSYLKSLGIAESRMTADGKSFNEPIADNSTKEGKAKNRRVEIFISANAQMIKAAEEGKLN